MTVYKKTNKHLLQRKREEGTATCCLGDDSKVFGVDGTKLRLVRTLRDLDAFVTILLLRRTAEHVTVLGRPHAKRHLVARKENTVGYRKS